MTEVMTASSTELQNNFGKYLNIVMDGQQIIVTKNGRRVARVIPEDAAVSYLTDSLTGILKGNFNLDEEKDKDLRRKYEAAG
ncbi:MAG: type II toxin-antitoxin system Phd/YefM family antitoxin [Syntrophomonadaceae bacterium]|jgi:prevent-host-death family protein